MLSKDTQLCISMSGNPSNIGTRFHNRLYDELGLDYVYKAFSPTDLAQAVARMLEVFATDDPAKQDDVVWLERDPRSDAETLAVAPLSIAHMLRENRVGNRRSSSLRSKNPMVATDMYYRPGRDI